MKKKLADWSPKLLQNLYASVLERLASDNLNQREIKAFTKRAEAIYRLGTHQDMKEVWEKLLAKKVVFIKYPVDKEQALIGTIQELIWFNSFGAERATPSENTEQLKEISKKIKELQRLIKKSGQASHEDKEVLETILHKRNVEYRQQKGEKMDMPPPNYLKYIDGDADTDLRTITLDEHMPWTQRTGTQRLGWWTREAMGMSLNEILDYYSERMGDYSKVYKTHYGQFQPKLIKGLRDLMKELYGSPLEDYVGRIASAILNKEITKDYVRGYKE